MMWLLHHLIHYFLSHICVNIKDAKLNLHLINVCELTILNYLRVVVIIISSSYPVRIGKKLINVHFDGEIILSSHSLVYTLFSTQWSI